MSSCECNNNCECKKESAPIDWLDLFEKDYLKEARSYITVPLQYKTEYNVINYVYDELLKAHQEVPEIRRLPMPSLQHVKKMLQDVVRDFEYARDNTVKSIADLAGKNLIITSLKNEIYIKKSDTKY